MKILKNNGIEKMFICIVSVMLLFCIFCNLIWNPSWLGYDRVIQIKYFLVWLPLISVVSYGVFKWKINFEKYIFILFVVMLICQTGLVYTLTTDVGWDCGMLINAATGNYSEMCNDYLSLYPNNLFLVFVFRIWSNILHTNQEFFIYGLNILNIFAVDISYLLLFMIIKICIEEKIGKLIALYFVCIIGISPWIVIPYSDLQMMPWGLLLFYLYLRLKEKNGKTTEFVFGSLLVGFAFFCGIRIKPTIVVIYIAICMMCVGRKNLKALCIFLCGIFLVFVLNHFWNSFVQKQDVFQIDENKSVPVTHYIMMGLNDNYGAYSEKDLEITNSGKNYQEKIKMNLEEIDKRIHNMNFFSHMKRLWKKLRFVYSEGNFFWGGEGGMNFINFNLDKYKIVRNLFYINGANYDCYKYSMQGIWFSLLLFTSLNVLKIKSYTCDSEMGILFLVILGITMFVLLFEARSRYLISFLPFFSMAAGEGAAHIWGGIE